MTFGTVEADPGTGGATFAVDLITGVTFPRTKLVWGAEGTATGVASGGAALPIQDGGNSITVDGAVTLGAALPAGTNNIGDVDVLTLPAISLAASSNNIGDVDVLSLPSLPAGTNNIGDVDVLSLPALAAGSNNIGKVIVTNGSVDASVRDLTNANPIDVAIVDASGNQLTAFGGGTQYTEGTTQATIVGTAMLWEDTSDVVRAVSAAKPLPVNIVAGAGSGGTASTDDAAFTAGAGSGTPAMGFVSSDTVDAGDVGVFAMLGNRQQKVTLYDSAGAEVAVGGGTQYAEDTVHVTGDMLNMAGVVRQDTATALSAAGDRAVLISDANGRLHVMDGNSTGILNAVSLLDDTVKTDDNSFAVASDKILMIGGLADETSPDGVDEGDAGVIRMTLQRGLHVNLRSAAGAELTPSQDATHDSAAISTGPQQLAYASSTAPANVTAADAVRLWALLNGTLAVNLRDSSGNEVTPSGGTQYDEDTAHVSGDKITMAGIVRSDTATAPSGTNGDRTVLISDANGRLHVNVGATVSTPVTNAGTFATQVDGAALTALQLLDDVVVADDAAFTVGTTKVSVAGFLADETATDSVDEGDAGAARMTLDRRQIVVPQPHSAGGLSIHRSLDLDEGTLEVVKASPGSVYGMWVTNRATATRWIKFYDATSGTVGTGTPVITIGIPGNSTDNIAANFGPGGMGIAFATGICVGCSTGFADADTGAPGANDIICNIYYK